MAVRILLGMPDLRVRQSPGIGVDFFLIQFAYFPIVKNFPPCSVISPASEALHVSAKKSLPLWIESERGKIECVSSSHGGSMDFI